MGRVHRSWLFIGIGIRLTQSAELNEDRQGQTQTADGEERRRCFWSLRLLNILARNGQRAVDKLPERVPMYPTIRGGFGEETQVSETNPRGERAPQRNDIMSYVLPLADVWHETVNYCLSRRQVLEVSPWLSQSTYSRLYSRFQEFEFTLADQHRILNCGFYELGDYEFQQNTSYWGAWLFLQFAYHTTLCLLHHPYTISVEARRQGPEVPKRFIDFCANSVLLHANWIDRFICMINEKGIPVQDPFLAYCATVAATVHLFSCYSLDTSIQKPAREKLVRCFQFVQELSPRWPIAKRMVERLSLINVRACSWTVAPGSHLVQGLTADDESSLEDLLTYASKEDFHNDETEFFDPDLTTKHLSNQISHHRTDDLDELPTFGAASMDISAQRTPGFAAVESRGVDSTPISSVALVEPLDLSEVCEYMNYTSYDNDDWWQMGNL